MCQVKDSNLGRPKSADLQSAPVDHLGNLAYQISAIWDLDVRTGAFVGDRTRDLSLTKTALYQLSYEGSFMIVTIYNNSENRLVLYQEFGENWPDSN